MISSALLALALTAMPTESRCRMDRSGDRFRNCSTVLPLFEFATASGVGMTAECGCTTNPTGTKGETMVFTRASDAWCEKSDLSWVKCATDKARVSYGDFQSSVLGLYVERASTNTVLRNRDMSDVAWTKTTMTCTKTATGIDGVSNSASTCTASAGNGIFSQAATCPAASAAASIFLKRRTGTGNIQVSCDGTNYTTVTLDSTWKRISALKCSPTTRCVTVAALSAAGCNSGGVYVRIVTNGDAVDADMAQCEGNGWTSTPIETAGTSATRVKETPYFDVAFGTSPAGNSVFSTNFTPIVSPAGQTSAVAINKSAAVYLWPFRASSTNMSCQLSGGGTSTIAGPNTISSTVESRTGCKATTVLNTTCTSGSCSNSGAISLTLSDATSKVCIGNWNANSDQAEGVVKQVCADNTYGGCGP